MVPNVGVPRLDVQVLACHASLLKWHALVGVLDLACHVFNTKWHAHSIVGLIDVWKTIQHKTHRQVYRVASSNKTHGSEVDPTGIEELSNLSSVVDLVKRIKYWLSDFVSNST
ncbi:hypothetical protein AHAS_Ahas01G0174200 [Arachis hypogaea]